MYLLVASKDTLKALGFIEAYKITYFDVVVITPAMYVFVLLKYEEWCISRHPQDCPSIIHLLFDGTWIYRTKEEYTDFVNKINNNEVHLEEL